MTVLDLMRQGGVALYPLAVCSFLVLAVIIERLRYYAGVGAVPQELLKRVEQFLADRNRQPAKRLLKDSPSPFARVALAGIEQDQVTAAEVTDALTMACEVEVAHAARPLPVLGTIGNIAPFIGLFGTVLGIMRAFNDVAANQGTASTSSAVHVSQGIAEALIATAVGLGVGILSVVANNWCNAWVENYKRELDHFATRFGARLANLPPADPEVLLDQPHVDPRLESVL